MPFAPQAGYVATGNAGLDAPAPTAAADNAEAAGEFENLLSQAMLAAVGTLAKPAPQPGADSAAQAEAPPGIASSGPAAAPLPARPIGAPPPKSHPAPMHATAPLVSPTAVGKPLAVAVDSESVLPAAGAAGDLATTGPAPRVPAPLPAHETPKSDLRTLAQTALADFQGQGAPPAFQAEEAAASLARLSASEHREQVAESRHEAIWSESAFSRESAPVRLDSQTTPAPGVQSGPSIADQIREAVASRFEEGRGPQGSQIHLRLNPPELGEVRIHLTGDDRNVSARLVVQEEGTRVLLEQNIQHVRQRLGEAGVSLAGMEIAWRGGDRSGSRNGSPAPGEESPLRRIDRAAPIAKPPLAPSVGRSAVDLLA